MDTREEIIIPFGTHEHAVPPIQEGAQDLACGTSHSPEETSRTPHVHERSEHEVAGEGETSRRRTLASNTGGLDSGNAFVRVNSLPKAFD